MAATPARSAAIPALVPRGAGHQFVLYGDSCSGVPGGRHEQAFARVNAVVRRLAPGPQFLVFAGDEVAGLTPEPRALRAQWRHWLDVEMGWRDRRAAVARDGKSYDLRRDERRHLSRANAAAAQWPARPAGLGVLDPPGRSAADLRAHAVRRVGRRRIRRDRLAARDLARTRRCAAQAGRRPSPGFSGQRLLGCLPAPDRAGGRRRVLGRARRTGRCRLPVQPHTGVRCAGAPRRAAGLHGGGRHRTPHARGRRVPALRADGARRRGAALSGIGRGGARAGTPVVAAGGARRRGLDGLAARPHSRTDGLSARACALHRLAIPRSGGESGNGRHADAACRAAHGRAGGAVDRPARQRAAPDGGRQQRAGAQPPLLARPTTRGR